MNPSVNQIYIEQIKKLKECFQGNVLYPLAEQVLSGIETRLSYYETLVEPLEQENYTIEDLVTVNQNLAQDLKSVSDNYNALLRRHLQLTAQIEHMETQSLG